METNSPKYSNEALLRLKQGIIESFNLAEIQALCFDLGIDFEEVAGITKDTKSLELIQFFIRRGELHKLVLHLAQVRPYRNWRQIIDAHDSTDSISSITDVSKKLPTTSHHANNITNIINTGGGSFISGDVTSGGDFVGRDHE